ncbi:MAG: methyltransferase domain-containing protein [Bacteroidales bacterium]|nr:methyltransferase domain-containing protein [Bacteroidales bacterium]
MKRMIPEKMAANNEKLLRGILYRFYKGKKYECTICNRKLRRFIILDNGEKLCPYCGSLPRNRRLWLLLKSEFLREHLFVLHFSPSKSLFGLLSIYPGIIYESTDISGDFMAHKHLDITRIDEPDSKYDLIICYHILEHVEKDKEAMSELYRILKPGGICMIQTPFKKGSIYENSAIKNPNDRKIHFGQEDHVRIYSVNGLKFRLEQNGFDVKVMHFSEDEHNYHGLKPQEYVFIASRKKDLAKTE